MTSALPRQLRFDLHQRIERTLVPMEVAMDFLQLGEDDVLAMVEGDKLPWAFNIGRKNAKRRDIRIWRECLLRLASGLLPGGEESLGEVIASAVPAPKADALGNRILRGVELKHRMSCSQFHLTHLIRDGELRVYGQTPTNHSPRIIYDSVVEFLKQRRIA